jgi:hypothetical protein
VRSTVNSKLADPSPRGIWLVEVKVNAVTAGRMVYVTSLDSRCPASFATALTVAVPGAFAIRLPLDTSMIAGLLETSVYERSVAVSGSTSIPTST